MTGWLRQAARRVASAPFGVLVMAALLGLLGAGLLATALYLLLTQAAVHWPTLAAAVAAAPLLLFFASQLLLLRRWTWLTSIILLALLLASSVVRAANAGEVPFAPVAEIVLELLFLGYLLRPQLRRSFGWDG